MGFYSTADQNSVLDKLSTEVCYFHICPPQSFIMLPMDKPFGAWVDEWGITQKFESGFDDLLGMPLAGKTISEIEKYPWPNQLGYRRYSAKRKYAHLLIFYRLVTDKNNFGMRLINAALR